MTGGMGFLHIFHIKALALEAVWPYLMARTARGA